MSFFKVLSPDANDYDDEVDGEVVEEYDEYIELTLATGEVLMLPISWLESIAELFQHNVLCPTNSTLH